MYKAKKTPCLLAGGELSGAVSVGKGKCRHRPIFPGRLQPSIFSTDELNYRVRNGNGWILAVIDTDFFLFLLKVLFLQNRITLSI